MLPRSTPAVLVATLALGLIGCSGIPAAPATPAEPAGPTPLAGGSAATLHPTVEPTVAPATATPDSGNVEIPVTPGLSVEPVGSSSIRVTLADPAAKAWRVTVAGTGAQGADRWALTVETGDVAPVVTTTETAGGVDAEPLEQPRLEMGDASGQVCSASVPVCLRAPSLVLPHDGNGTLVLELARSDAGASMSVTGGTATWTTDPFVLSSWTTTEAFPWAP